MKQLMILATLALLAPTAFAQSRYAVTQDSGDWVVRDARTGLTWRHCPEGMTSNGQTCSGNPSSYSWAQALAQGSTQGRTGGRGAWRVPDIKELSSIVDRTRYGSAADPAVFPNTPSGDFWTSTPNADDVDRSRYVSFYYGNGYAAARSTGMHIRLVRSGS